MKRVTILVDDIGEPDGDGERMLVGTRPGTVFDAYVAADRVLAIEDHVEPLPTEPGVRFWGQLGDREPQWWFTRELNGLIYLGARGGAYYPDSKPSGRTHDLVRLPDPKPTETDGAR